MYAYGGYQSYFLNLKNKFINIYLNKFETFVAQTVCQKTTYLAQFQTINILSEFSFKWNSIHTPLICDFGHFTLNVFVIFQKNQIIMITIAVFVCLVSMCLADDYMVTKRKNFIFLYTFAK